MAASICGIDCTKCGLSSTCNGCMETNGRPFGAECMAALCLEKGEKELCESERNLIAAFRALNIEDMEEITELHALKGSLINLEYTLPNEQIIRFWNDDKIYLGNQLSKKGSDRYYGMIADENYLMVSEYSGSGSDAELVAFMRWRQS